MPNVIVTIFIILTVLGNICGFSGKLRPQTQDQSTTRANTLADDADDLQRQLDNEVRDRVKFGRPKTIWFLQLPKNDYKFEMEKPRIFQSRQKKDSECTTEEFQFLVKAELGSTYYYEEQGNWSQTFPECGGRSQSPVDFPVVGLVKAHGQRPLTFCNYDELPINMSMVWDGNRLILNGVWKAGKHPIVYGGAAHSRRYAFQYLTIHMPSEHSIGSIFYPLETQLIYISADYKNFDEALKGSARDRMAFMGIVNIFRYEKTSFPALVPLLDAATKAKTFLKPMPLSKISPPFHTYASYHGSLTTPPCAEAVLWMIRSKTLPVERSVLEAFKYLLTQEGPAPRLLFRAVQPLNDRKVILFNA